MRLISVIVSALILSACAALSPVNSNAPSDMTATAVPLSSVLSIALSKDILEKGLPSTSLSRSHIIYRGIENQERPRLEILSVGDGKVRRLDNYPAASGGVQFLRDGQHFLVMGHDDLWLGDIKGSPPDQIQINNALMENFQPYSRVWSDLLSTYQRNPPQEASDYYLGRLHAPDNRTIASWKQADRTLILLNRTTSKEHEVISTGAQDLVAGAWTADSKHFIFAYTHNASDTYYGQILMVSSDSAELQPLTQQFENLGFESPILSPDGEKVAFRITQGEEQAVGILWLSNHDFHIYRLDQENNGSWFLYGSRSIWSPDSQWIALIIGKEPFAEDIVFLNIETGESYCMSPDPPLKDILMDWR